MSAQQMSALAGFNGDPSQRVLTVVSVIEPVTGGLDVKFSVPSDFEHNILFFTSDTEYEPEFWVLP